MHKAATVLESLHRHVETRVDDHYPRDIYTDVHGAIPPEFRAMADSQASSEHQSTGSMKSESAYEMKQSTMPDAADEADKVFTYARPTLVVGEATTADALDRKVVVDHAVGSVSRTSALSRSHVHRALSETFLALFSPPDISPRSIFPNHS